MQNMLVSGSAALAFVTSSLVADTWFDSPENHAQVQAYIQLIEKQGDIYGPICDHSKGEIQLIIDPEHIYAIQREQFAKKTKAGRMPEQAREDCRVGIVWESTYWKIVRDPVRFPSGADGLYERHVNHSACTDDQIAGAAVLPVFYDEIEKVIKFAFIRTHRHATRGGDKGGWRLELPRGTKEPGDSFYDTVLKEGKEEGGLKLNKKTVVHLVTADTDSGLTMNRVALCMAQVLEMGASKPESSEAIETRVHLLTIKQTNEAIKSGLLVDTFAVAALYLAQHSGHNLEEFARSRPWQ